MKNSRINTFFLATAITVLISCKESNAKIDSEKLRHLDDIPFNVEIDDSSFIICNGEDQIFQYFNLGSNIEIEGDKPRIVSFFKSNYDETSVPKESGLIRIRFVVNCTGDTGRFRSLESDLNYNEKKFDRSISNQILTLTKSLKGWKVKYDDGVSSDYYQYLIFKIVKGKIIKILP